MYIIAFFVVVFSTPIKVTLLPYYGGAKGQTLQIIETASGQVSTQIVNIPFKESNVEQPQPVDVEMPQLPNHKFEEDIRKIHENALKILELQNEAKKNGKLNENERKEYEKTMDLLTKSADDLSKLHESKLKINEEEDDDLLESRSTGLSEWFDRKKNNKKEKEKRKEEADRKKLEEEQRKEEEKKRLELELEEEKRRKEELEKEKEEEEKRKLEQEEHFSNNNNGSSNGDKEDENNTDNTDNTDSISVNLPGEDAAVAEAKPIGLAIAGVGGVAASKPIATAVVGPGGLAIARPVGTAIAGVSPEQALVPIYPEGYLKPAKRPKKGSKKEAEDEYLNKLLEKYHHV